MSFHIEGPGDTPDVTVSTLAAASAMLFQRHVAERDIVAIERTPRGVYIGHELDTPHGVVCIEGCAS